MRPFSISLTGLKGKDHLALSRDARATGITCYTYFLNLSTTLKLNYYGKLSNTSRFLSPVFTYVPWLQSDIPTT